MQNICHLPRTDFLFLAQKISVIPRIPNTMVDTGPKLVEGLEELSPFAEHVLRPFTQSQISGLGVRPKKGTRRLVFWLIWATLIMETHISFFVWVSFMVSVELEGCQSKLLLSLSSVCACDPGVPSQVASWGRAVSGLWRSLGQQGKLSLD